MPCVMVGESVANIVVGEEHPQRRRKNSITSWVRGKRYGSAMETALPVSLGTANTSSSTLTPCFTRPTEPASIFIPGKTGQIDLPW